MSNLTGTDKSVILLMTIGEDRAAEVFKHLSQREVQTLSAAMANVTQISNKQLTDVLAEFEQDDAPRDKCAHFREINGIAAAFQHLQKNYIPAALSFL